METSSVKKFQSAENIASIFSNYKVKGEKTIYENLTIKSIPLFEALLPEIVIYKIPTYNGTLSPRQFIVNMLKMRFKHFLKNIIYGFKISDIKKNNLHENDSLIFLVFNKLMLSQIINPFLGNLNSEVNSIAIVDSNSSIDNKQISVINSQNLNLFEKIKLIYEIKKIKNLILKDLPSIHNSLNCLSILEIKDFVNWLFYERIFALTNEVYLANEMLSKLKCKCIISTDIADPKARIFCLAAKKNKTKTLQIQYGLIDETSYEYRYPLFDKIAVFGENSKTELLKHGFLENWIEITGSIKYDKKNYTNSVDLFTRFNIEKNKKIILLASTYFIKGFENVKNIANQVMLDLFKIIKDNDDLVLIIKPHPILNSESQIRKISKKFPKIYFAHPNENIVKLIVSCDVFINFGSTSNIDGILANKLVINPVYDNWTEPNNLLSTGLILTPSNSSQLESNIKIVLNSESFKAHLQNNNEKKQAFIEKNIYKFDNNNFQRILNLINL